MHIFLILILGPMKASYYIMYMTTYTTVKISASVELHTDVFQLQNKSDLEGLSRHPCSVVV